MKTYRNFSKLVKHIYIIGNIYFLAVLCDPGFIYCGDPGMSSHPCLPTSDVCNNYKECNTLGADESICNSCPKNYCINGGTCDFTKSGAPVCR